jgi:NNP family nitrate/nitrite transporter-like MFS transporter
MAGYPFVDILTAMPRRALTLATISFLACFYAWSLLGPLGPDLQDRLGLSDVELAAMVAVPVLLGSIMRIPLGALTDRYGGGACSRP